MCRYIKMINSCIHTHTNTENIHRTYQFFLGLRWKPPAIQSVKQNRELRNRGPQLQFEFTRTWQDSFHISVTVLHFLRHIIKFKYYTCNFLVTRAWHKKMVWLLYRMCYFTSSKLASISSGKAFMGTCIRMGAEAVNRNSVWERWRKNQDWLRKVH